MNWYNPTEGTWVVSGEFATSSILAGSGIWIEDAKGSGNLLITYTASGAKVFSSGVLQFSTMMAPAGVVTLSNKGTLGSVKYHPRAFTDAEAIALATGDITVSFTLRNLLNNSPQGVWYDPSDTTTLFQDSAGTTPVTASGQPVGRMLDKSGRGNHATQPTAASRPIYRRGDSRGVVNLLTRSEAFDNAVWAKGTDSTAIPNTTLAPDGSMTGDTYQNTGNNREFSQTYLTPTPEGGTFTASISIKPGTLTTFGYKIRRGDTSDGITVNDIQISSGTPEPNGFYRHKLTHTFSGSTTGDNVVVLFGANFGATGNMVIHGAQLNLGPTALPYQRNDATLGGVATGASTDLHWLETDGVDDGMVTGNIDFTGTDKVSVFAGVRKLSDAARGVLVELGTSTSTNNGSLGLEVPDNPGTTVAMRSRGTLPAYAVAVIATAPVSLIMSSVNNIAGDVCSLRSNGSIVATAAADQGTGNFGKYPLYLFRRGGTTLPFNGWFYGLAITGRLTTDAETVATERLLAAKSAVVIP